MGSSSFEPGPPLPQAADAFPTTPGAYRTSAAGLDNDNNGFVTRLNPLGSGLVYSTFLGAPGGVTTPTTVAVDSAGTATIVGDTGSAAFPTTPGAYQTTGAGTFTSFLTRFNPAGSGLMSSNIIGQAATTNSVYAITHATAVALDPAGDAYVTGSTNLANFPTVAAFQPTLGGGPTFLGDQGSDALVTEYNPAGSEVVFSSYLGGDNTVGDGGSAIAVGPGGDIYLARVAGSTDFPTNPGAYNRTATSSNLAADFTFFVAKIIPSVQFATPTSEVAASAGAVIVTVTRTGSTSEAAMVRVATGGGARGRGPITSRSMRC